jgi:dihydrofolate reductase
MNWRGFTRLRAEPEKMRPILGCAMRYRLWLLEKCGMCAWRVDSSSLDSSFRRRIKSMPKIVVNAFLTLDGVTQGPGGPDEDLEGGFVHGGWQAPYGDEASGRLITEGIADADGFLLGRKTYELFANYWSKITDTNNPIATALNSRPKYVLSRSLTQVTWNNSRLIKGDVIAEVQKLRQQPGRTLHTWGSADALQTLMKNDLIDEYRLFIYPVILGSGKRLFRDGAAPVALKQVETLTNGKGAHYHRLTRSGKPEYGRIGG